MYGRDTLNDSKTTDGLKEWQSGHHENGQNGRDDLKQDGDNLIRHLGPAWPRIARDRHLWRQLRVGYLLAE